MKLFVYGTLKSNRRNNYFLYSSNFIKESTTYFKYPMLKRSRFGFFSYPVLFNEPKMGNYIKGEVYEVNETIMKRLDLLEGVFYNLYKRGNILINTFEPEIMLTYFINEQFNFNLLSKCVCEF